MLKLKNGDFRLLYIALAICCVGLYGIFMVAINGQEASYGVSREIPLGLLLMGYAFFVGISVGISTLISVDHIFEMKFFHKEIKRLQLLAIAALLAAFWLIFWELGSPFKFQVFRFVKYYTNFAFGSPIWWMSTFYLIETPLLILELFLMIKGDHKATFWASIVGFVMGIVAFSTLSMVFAVNGARPIWHTAQFTISFVFGALACGVSAVSIFIYLRKILPNPNIVKNLAIFLFFILLAILFIDIWTIIISSYAKGSYLAQNFAVITSGPLSFNFYVLEIFVGIILPILLLVFSKFNSIKILFVASILSIVGVFFGRFDGVIGGQIVKVESEFLPQIEYGSYIPSAAEITIFISAVGVMLFIYALGRAFLDLEDER